MDEKKPIVQLYVNKLSFILPEHLTFYLIDTLNKFEINNLLRISHFLSQVMHESGNFFRVEENLNYSAKRLLEVFPKYFSSLEIAKQYEKNPKKIASKVYANRLGNGDEASEDGWKFRGRGFIQLTGKTNYKEFGEYIKEDLLSNPELLSIPKYAMLSSGWFWHKRDLNIIADFGKDVEIIKKITKIINGGYNGLQDRINKFNKIHNLLNT